MPDAIHDRLMQMEAALRGVLEEGAAAIRAIPAVLDGAAYADAVAAAREDMAAGEIIEEAFFDGAGEAPAPNVPDEVIARPRRARKAGA